MHPTALILTFCAAMSCAYAEEPKQPQSGFEVLDANRNGYISAEEANSLRGLKQLMDYFDADLDGRLSRKEFERLLRDAAHSIESMAKNTKAQ